MSYAKVRDKLLEQKARLQKRIDEVVRDVRHDEEPLNQDFAEQAVEREHEEVMDALGLRCRRELAAVDRALLRIDGGDYGMCLECGEAIPEARLEILPFSEYCVSCAEGRDG